LTIGGSGSIESDGKDGGKAPPTSSYGGNFPSGAGGGGSGGGAVFALHYGALSNSGAITAAKGDKGLTYINGGGSGAGGDGGVGGVHTSTVDVAESYTNMTLASNAYTAQTAPTTARIILDEYTSTGSSTLNTDIKAYASRDNGTTYTQITLASQGTIETNHRLLSGSVDISGQPAGTSIKYKIETLNQTSGKQTRVYGTSMAWA
jgi:hypothetical protein